MEKRMPGMINHEKAFVKLFIRRPGITTGSKCLKTSSAAASSRWKTGFTSVKCGSKSICVQSVDTKRSGAMAQLLAHVVGVRLENGIYGHSRFCNTDFDEVGLLESIRRLNGILFPRLDEFRA
jgi:hypothetical protein